MTVRFDYMGEAVPTRDAATIVLVREGADRESGGVEVLFVRRSGDAKFMGGAWVFPGGKLDAGDPGDEVPCNLDAASAARSLGEGEDDGARARGLYVAALRECFEEAGVLLATSVPTREVLDAMRARVLERGCDFGALLRERSIALDARSVVPFARWITPVGESRRFDARFFLAAMPHGAVASHDARETTATLWCTPSEALARARRSEILLAPPTWRTVEQLERHRSIASLLAAPAPGAVPRYAPTAQLTADGTVLILLPGDRLHEANDPAPALEGTPAFVSRFAYRDGHWLPA